MPKRFQAPCACMPIIMQDGKVLLHRRQNTGYADGLWDLAGSGHVDPRETMRQTVAREAGEELGIVVRTEDVRFATMSYGYWAEDQTTYVDSFFLVTRYLGVPRIMEPDKCAELSWFPLFDLPDDLIDNRRAALENFMRGIAYHEFGWDTFCGARPMPQKHTSVPGAVLMLTRGAGEHQEILLQKRGNTGYAAGMWDVSLSGHVEPGESYRMAISREAGEELGIAIAPDQLHFGTMTHKHGPISGHTFVNVFFTASAYAGIPRVMEPEKCAELAWSPIRSLPAGLLPDRRQAIENVLHGVSYGETGW